MEEDAMDLHNIPLETDAEGIDESTHSFDRADLSNDDDESVGEEPRLTLPDKGTVLFSDYIKETRKVVNPNFKPIFAAVSHLTLSVRAPAPTSHHRDVLSLFANQFNRLVPEKRPQPVAILNDVSFYARPGEMTLILGAPGCGKSSLLKLLANRLRAGKVEGSLTFNGKVPKRKHYHRDVAFIQQEDVHMATLTVKETLRFSADCQMPPGVSSSVKAERVEAILQLLGLKHRADTIVGDALLRGVSGGEKKRVTVGIEWTKSPGVWLFDEPTTGLDSSASYDVMRALRTIVNMGGTAMVSLLQPSYETFHLFDNVMILTRGEIAYLGKRAEALPYFERLGYKCRSTLNPAEFLQEVVESISSANPSKYRAVDEAQEADSDSLAAVADEDFDWLEPKDFVAVYKKSPHYEHVIETISETNKDLTPNPEDHKADHPAKIELVDYARDAKYPTSIPMQYWLLTKRALTREWRDKTTNIMRIISTCALACILGTLFLRLGYDQSDINSRVGLTFAVLAYWAFGSLTALPLTIFERPVFYMQRDQKYYRTSPYLFSTIIAEIPTMLIEVVAFSSILYWLANLNADGGRFGYFILANFLFAWTMRSFTRTVSVWSPSLLYAQSFAPTFIALLLMFGGYLVPRIHIYGWWIWMYWANPVSYAFQGLASNEFWGQTFSCTASELVPPTSAPEFSAAYPEGFGGNQACPVTSGTNFIVDNYGIFDREWLKWIMVVCLIAWWLIFTLATYVGLRFVRHAPPKKPRMKTVEITEEEEQEMRQFNIKEVKARHLKDHSSDKVPIKRDVDDDLEAGQVYSDDGHEKMGGEFVEGGAYLSWRNLNYSVFARSGLKKDELQLLHDVSGYVKPGMMLALMGSSGAGKSTLMDVLARRKTGGKITGEVLVNGRKTDNNLSRIIGYVEQQDIHAPTQTIYEAIELSALCRLPAVIPVEDKKKYARSLLKILGLESIANRVIGVNAADGISADQRKRVTIGVEMAADPAILFLDEPTSGLDSFGAERVMNAVKNIASRGTSVVCTIHQPSATIFGMFTHLLLLKKGGFTTYFGPIGKQEGDYSVMLDYFSQMGQRMKPHQNPAEFILEVTGAGIPKDQHLQNADVEAKDVESGARDENYYVEAYKHSQFYTDTQKLLEAGIFPAPKDLDEEEKSRWRKLKDRLTHRYASTYLQQFTQTMKRSFLAYWRSPEEFLQKVTVPLALGVIIGTYFLQLDDTQQGAAQRGGLLYFTMLITNLLGIQLKAKVIQERPFMYRERASRTYTSLVYLANLILVEVPFALWNTVTYVIPVYFIAGLQYDAGKFWIFFSLYLLGNLLSIAIVYVLCLAAPNITIANALSALVFTLYSNLAGFLITRNNIPGWWIWAHYLDIDMYGIESLLINELKGKALTCSVSELVAVPIAGMANTFKYYCPHTTGDDFINSLGMSTDNLLRDSLVLLGWWIALIVAAGLLLKFVVHQKR